jgi:hypothetical protein
MGDNKIRTLRMSNVVFADFRPLYRGLPFRRDFRDAELRLSIVEWWPIRSPDQIFRGGPECVTQAYEILRPDSLNHVGLPLPNQSARDPDFLR